MQRTRTQKSCFLIALNFNCTDLLIIVCFSMMVRSSAMLYMLGLEGILWMQFSPFTFMWVLRMKLSPVLNVLSAVSSQCPPHLYQKKKNQRENGDNVFMYLLVTWEKRDQTIHLSLVRMTLFMTLTEYCYCQKFVIFPLCQIPQTV